MDPEQRRDTCIRDIEEALANTHRTRACRFSVAIRDIDSGLHTRVGLTVELDREPFRLIVRAVGHRDKQADLLAQSGFERIETGADRRTGLANLAAGTRWAPVAFARDLEPGFTAEDIYERLDWIMTAVFGAPTGYEPVMMSIGFEQERMTPARRLAVVAFIVGAVMVLAGIFAMVTHEALPLR